MVIFKFIFFQSRAQKAADLLRCPTHFLFPYQFLIVIQQFPPCRLPLKLTYLLPDFFFVFIAYWYHIPVTHNDLVFFKLLYKFDIDNIRHMHCPKTLYRQGIMNILHPSIKNCSPFIGNDNDLSPLAHEVKYF